MGRIGDAVCAVLLMVGAPLLGIALGWLWAVL